MAVCFAIIGRDNSRLFTRIADREAAREYDLQLFVHCTLDIVDEKTPKAPELYLGMLNADSRYRAFGYVSNSGVRFILVTLLSNTSLRELEIRAIFKRFHMQYTNALSNPFYEFGKPFQSKALDECAADIFRSTAND